MLPNVDIDFVKFMNKKLSNLSVPQILNKLSEISQDFMLINHLSEPKHDVL